MLMLHVVWSKYGKCGGVVKNIVALCGIHICSDTWDSCGCGGVTSLQSRSQ